MDKKGRIIFGGLAFVAAVGYYAYEIVKAKRQQEIIDITDQKPEEIQQPEE